MREEVKVRLSLREKAKNIFKNIAVGLPLEWLLTHCQEAWSLLSKELLMGFRLLEVRLREFFWCYRFNNWLCLQDCCISDQLPRWTCMTSDNGSCNLHGWELSKEKAMNCESWDQSSRNQPDFNRFMTACLKTHLVSWESYPKLRGMVEVERNGRSWSTPLNWIWWVRVHSDDLW